MFGTQTAKKVLEGSKKKQKELTEMKKTLAEDDELGRVGKAYENSEYERLSPAHFVGGSTGVGLAAVGVATANPVAIAAGVGSATFGIAIGEYDKSMEADNIRDSHKDYMEENEVELNSENLQTQ